MEKKLYLTSLRVLLVFAIVFAIIIPFLTPSKDTETQTASITPSKDTEIQNSLKETDRNSYYCCLASNLMGSFPKVLIQTEYGEKEVTSYPPEYGGAYIDESNTLHILLTKTANMTTKTSYLEIMDNDEDIIFEIVDFPLSLLYDVQRTLGPVMGEFGIEGSMLNEVTNRLDLHLFDDTPENEIIDFLENKFNDFDVNCLTFNGPLGIRLSATDMASNQ